MTAVTKRCQEKQQNRILNHASKRFSLAEVEDSVIIPISHLDKVHSLGPRNILGCITSRDGTSYSIGTDKGALAVNYTRNQLEVCPTKLLPLDSIPPVSITQRESMQSSFLGISSNSACCKKAKRVASQIMRYIVVLTNMFSVGVVKS
ncbi:KRAB-A domain-containing protein 2-like isoform X2 [Oopsacas minuta]|uniref:KRAB-A domain-containing protein 2-like isoform X2 n=1 Tax=Oopsacas minuta TaxID=111878 RepID=A0AAV7JWZ4_9METZ|nr:KRAB-A domain-containing protein 2-like isoform X2 [Oopsacas minuta]